MKISVAIITYNRPKDVNECIRSILLCNKKPFEIVIVDDSPDKETSRIFHEIKPELDSSGISSKYVHNEKKLGQTAARNQSIKLCSGDVVAFLDDDAIVSPDWAQAIDDGYSNRNVVGVGGPALLVDGELRPIFPIDGSEENQNKITKFGKIEDGSSKWIPPRPVQTEHFLGANMSFKKSVLLRTGGFDPNYTGNQLREETDLCVGIAKTGKILIYHPGALVLHKQTMQGGCRHTIKKWSYDCGYNNTYFIKKNYAEKYASLQFFALLMEIKKTAYRIIKEKKGIRDSISGCIQYFKGSLDSSIKNK